ncbi:MAG: TIGR04282 family arsenosugar biosynthesis glycosyltransferase, partial [Rubrivivax sp.]|nr:TIGR04282 family arsenosugar biosynthesis glycosyltransferase [Rubrivivax sp.]
MSLPGACRIAVLAKAPVAGYAKTRLTPALGAAGAAALAERLLEHAVAQAMAAGLGPVVLWAAPDTTHPAFVRLRDRHGLGLAAQGAGDLGARMARVFEQTLATGGAPLLLMGTDAPALDAAMLRRAAAALGEHDAVFVPALDGGYALVGLRGWGPGPLSLFTDMAWSTPQVMAQTRARLATAGLRHAELPAVADIDEPADLAHLPRGWQAAAAVTMPHQRRRFPAMTDTPTQPEDAAPDAAPAAAQPGFPEPAAPDPTVAAEGLPPPAISAPAACTAPKPATEPSAAAAAPQAAADGADESAGASAVRGADAGALASDEASDDASAETGAEASATAGAAPPAVAELSPAACAARLAELFPALFGAGRALPIKLRVQADIQQRAPGLFTRKSLSPFLHRYTTSTAYLKALVNSPHRYDLDGAPAGEIDDVHRQAAATELERRRSLFEAKRVAERAAVNEARKLAEAAARQEHAAEDQARRDRAALLRAFESSTLTRANFCALKGIADAELDGRLHQAWLEREQRAQEMRPAPEQRPQAFEERRPDERPDRRPGPRRDAGPGDRPPGGA